MFRETLRAGRCSVVGGRAGSGGCGGGLALGADQMPTKTALHLLTHALANATRNGRLPPARIPAGTSPAPQSMASPLPVPLPEQQIPRGTWAAIVALHARYPKELERLKDGWWEDNSQTETLTALVRIADRVAGDRS